MSKIQIADVTIYNSNYTVDKIISPFCRVFILVICFLVVYFVLSKIGKGLLKKGVYFTVAKKFLKIFECATVLLALVIAVYSKTDSFEYSQYGVRVSTIEKMLLIKKMMYLFR